MKNLHTFTPFLRLVLGIVVIVLVGYGVFSIPYVQETLKSWRVLPQPERLTEAYFTDHQNLPTKYTPNSLISVDFTLHNIEYKTTLYKYQILQQSEDKSVSRVLASGEKSLSHDEIANIKVPVTMQDTGPRARVIVDITYEGTADGTDNREQKNQSIFYWARQQGGAN